MFEQLAKSIPDYIEQSGMLAPFFFILFHIVRPIFFLPVVFVCMVGGYLFGVVYGSVFSIIGLTLMSILFYLVAQKFPRILSKIEKVNQKMLNDNMMTMKQIFVLRMLPFAHFHLLSLYIMERTNNFKEYIYYSFLGVIAPSILFTSFGQMIIELPLIVSVVLLLLLGGFFYTLKRTEEKSSVKWKKFFETS